MRKFLIAALLALVALPAAAQRRPRVKLEWGGMAGLNIVDFSTSDAAASVRNKLGWQAGIITAVDFGAFAIEPQILYVRQGLRIRPDGEQELNLKSSSIDVPVLVSLRLLRPVRIYAGPVFTVMNDCKQKSARDLLDFGRVRPTLSFTVGAGVQIMRHLIVDLRYNGQFKGKEDVALPSGHMLDKLRQHNFALSFGYIF